MTKGGQAAGVVALQVPELTDGRLRRWSARLFYAYADALLDVGRAEEARDWFGRAAAADKDEETDAAERFENLDTAVFEDLADISDAVTGDSGDTETGGDSSDTETGESTGTGTGESTDTDADTLAGDPGDDDTDGPQDLLR